MGLQLATAVCAHFVLVGVSFVATATFDRLAAFAGQLILTAHEHSGGYVTLYALSFDGRASRPETPFDYHFASPRDS